MGIDISIPDLDPVELTHLVIDVNGTLTDRGTLIDGVAARLTILGDRLHITLVSADTYGTLSELSRQLQVESQKVVNGGDKLALLERLGADHCVVVGNGTNDALILGRAALGIAVVGPEGAARQALVAADVVCRSIEEALDLLLDPAALAATLRP